jgi:hypothetical protein
MKPAQFGVAVVKKINEVVVSLFFLLQMIVLSVEQPSS